MKAKVIKPFVDKVEGVTRKIGDAFDASEERFEEINSTKFGVLAVAVIEGTAKPKSRRKPKRGD